jgi:two-component system, sensor histidine kinase and response regulator
MIKYSKITGFFQFLIGSEAEFEPEHRFLNIICLLIGSAYLITIPINFLLELSTTNTIINLGVSISAFILYYLARFRRMAIFTTALLLAFVFISLSVDWYLAGGIISGISYYFFSLLVVILFLFNGVSRIILSLLVVLNVMGLITSEYFYPQLVQGYSSRQQMFLDHCSNFILAGPFVIFAVYYSKQLYFKEKQNTIAVIEKYRKSSEYLKEQMNKKLVVLSVREREIFRLIIEGKSNKEIATILFISDLTVKKHITSLFKKIGAKKRNELFDFDA